MNNKGCWIFISHSSADIYKIRIIRNEFEKYGQNPLAFHLKCLTTDTEEGRAELDSLIKREIVARDWFVYCESKAAAKSQYVQMERDFVKSCSKKMIWHLNLDDDMESILKKVKQICCSMQVFISYSHNDTQIAMQLSKSLKEKDFGVWNDLDLMSCTDWSTSIENKIMEVAKSGFVVLLLTRNSINSKMVNLEAESANRNGAKLIVLIFDDVLDYNTAYKRYNTIHIYNVPNIPKEGDMHLLVTLIEKTLERNIIGAIDKKANVYNAVSMLQSKLNYNRCYHSRAPLLVQTLGAFDDYCEVYQFPCCGKYVIIGDGVPSLERADGCCRKNTDPF